jgi:AGZA family xanthine/uracil permease-like MFS transporter
MTRYRWAQWGDINAFFGLMLDNVAVMILLVVGVTSTTDSPDHFSAAFVLGRMIPGTAIGVLIGDLVYTLMAFRLAKRTGRSDITAMPLGLDTPSSIGVAFFVLLPALKEGRTQLGLDHDTAMVYAWHVGALLLVMIGVFKTVCAPLGNAVRRWVPRAGLLGSLAAIALALIAFMPLADYIAALPVVGFVSLAVILITLLAHRALPGKIPGALAAVVAGIAIYLICQALGQAPPPKGSSFIKPVLDVPAQVWQWHWWQQVAIAAFAKLPIFLPFALATVVGGIDCTESAAAAGDEYDTRTILLTEGLASVAAGVCGGVIQTTPYIGQPAYKVMGGRAAYTLATGLFIGAAGLFGWLTHLFEWLPQAAMFPILVYVGLEITAQSFRATPSRHYPALAIAFLPALAYLATIPVDIAFAGHTPNDAHAVQFLSTLRCLANGFIVTSLLWAAALAALLDGRLIRAAMYNVVAGLCALFGVIHSPLNPAAIALPQDVLARLPQPAGYQTPYHWTAAYGLTALLLVCLAPFGKPAEGQDQNPDLPTH